MKQFLLFFFLTLLIGIPFSSHSQTLEGFSDGDFTSNPAWIGDDSVFTVIDVSGNLKLRSNKLLPSTTFYLSTQNTLATDKQWEFSLKLSFNTSSTNFVDVYLTSDQSNLLAANLSGYFVRVGGTTDEISLYKTVNGTATKIIDGVDAILGSSNDLRIKAICTATNDWTLDRDLSGTGVSYVTEGTITDASITTSSFFGIKITQSTASFFQKHFLDSLYIGPIIIDVTPPTILSSTVLDATHVDVLFSEPVEQSSAENAANYGLVPVNTLTALRDGSNLALVHLTLGTALGNGVNNTLTCNGINDNFGNTLTNQSTNFLLLIGDVPAKGDVIITEFFCDPSPKIGLPEIEFVEIFNKSNKIFELTNWKLGDNSSTGTIGSGWIFPGEYKVLCTTSAVDSFPNSIAVSSFPSLNNSGDDIALKDTGSIIIDKLIYDDTWYGDAVKMDGGYTLELINPNDPCSNKDNWTASMSLTGGTPGAVNSVFDVTPDTQNPGFFQLSALAPNFVSVDFTEGMDSTSVANSLVGVNPSLTIAAIYVLTEAPTNVVIQFNENLVGSQVYQISMQNVADCWMNATTITGNFVLPEDAQAGDVVINEILADALTGGSDFIEIKNNSSKYIDLKDYELANFDNDTISNNKLITDHFILLSGDYVVLTPDSSSQKLLYPATVSGRFIQMSLPTYSNDSGTVYLIKGSTVVDKVSYTSDWHFALLDNTDGKSLERIDPTVSSNDPKNWHTASETIGFATPGRYNSQLLYGESDGVISFTKDLFSPDNDGTEDVLQINFKLINAGMLANVSIYDDRGRLIRKLVKNELIGSTGNFTWDGVNDDQQKASIGTYVLLFEAFDLNGKTIAKKLPFVLAGKI